MIVYKFLHIYIFFVELLIAPNNLTAVNISSKSVTLTWKVDNYH